MSRMMLQAAVTMNQLQRQLDVIGNNIANVQTPGYKARQTEFSSLLFQQINNLSDPANLVNRLTPDGIRVGSGARLGDIQKNLSAGAMINSDRSLDTALVNAQDLYVIEVTENNVSETRYTRDGSFYVSPVNENQVMLTTSDGNPVLNREGNRIIFSNEFNNITITNNGTVQIHQGDTTLPVGQINVITAHLPNMLEAAGENQFRLPDLAALEMNEGEIIQNTGINDNLIQSNVLEQSNVNLANEMAEMLLTQRSYQFNARTITMADQMFGLVNQLR